MRIPRCRTFRDESVQESESGGRPLELSLWQWRGVLYLTAYNVALRVYLIPSYILQSYRICWLNWLTPYLRQPWATATTLESPIPTNMVSRKVHHLGVANSGRIDTTAHASPTALILKATCIGLIRRFMELECHYIPCSNRRFVNRGHNNIRSRHLVRNCL